MYHRDRALAQAGTEHLRRAESLLATLQANPLDAAAVNQAQQEFAAAEPIFVQIDADLKPLPGISTSIPIYGARLSAALHLASAAIELSRAGITGCDILNILISRLHNPLNIRQGQGLTMADLTTMGQDFHHIETAFNLAIDEINQVHSTDLEFDPHLGQLFATFQKELPTLQAWLVGVDKLLPALPALLGVSTSTNYLIEVLDSTELRPGGGFIGNYGIVTFSGGRLINAHITDVDLLDRPFEAAGKRIPLPPQYSWFNLTGGDWSLRDSNLEADFPTSARAGELNYMREGGNVPVQGVIAITPAFIGHVLEIIGPIDVPEYHETVTAQNLIDRIHFHQLGRAGEGSDVILSPDGHSSLRKRFTELLAEHLLTRVRQLAPSALPRFVQLLVSAVHTKDVQLYFNQGSAEHLLQLLHLDAAIQSPTGDSLLVVDANIAGNKANEFIIATLVDKVTVDTAGNAEHHTTLTYAWTLSGQNYGSPIYKDYVRVYVPADSTLQAQDGWQPRGSGQVFGHEVWAGFFSLTYGKTRSISFTWTVPGVASKDANGWHYHYLIQRQAGMQRMSGLQVMLPACATLTNASGAKMSTGKQGAMFTQSLTEDVNVEVDYVC